MTNFMFFGLFSLDFLFHMYFVYVRHLAAAPLAALHIAIRL